MPSEPHAARAHIIQVPYDSGHRNCRLGLGPARLAEAGIGSVPAASIGTIEVEERAFELGTTGTVLRPIAEKVKLAAQEHRFPMLRAGGCIRPVGALGIGVQTCKAANAGIAVGRELLAAACIDVH